ncbi:MAG: response regulator transcription factor [Nitrospirales bacterium]|nr:response regulator transcription factor [Nitrospira sp.]MDR4501398.1 response regulator transcription factor [Nitrospirales bacterium]
MTSQLDSIDHMQGKALIVDDHLIFRQGLKEVISLRFPNLAFGDAGTAKEAWQIMQQEPFKLLFLDISLPDKSGLDFLHEVRAYGIKTPAIVLSCHPEEHFGLRVLKINSSSYLRKDCNPEELYECLRRMITGKKYVTNNIKMHLAEIITHPNQSKRHHLLSNREFEVLRLLAMGNTPKMIADKLYLSVKTVSTHRTKILQKLQLRTTAEIFRYTQHNNLFADINV